MNYQAHIKFITWNVRGLNERPKRLAVRQTILIEKPNVICLQETKMAHMNDLCIRETCGNRLDQRRILDAQGTRGDSPCLVITVI